MIDRAHTEDTLFRTAVSALRYYPGRPNVEEGYTLSEDVDWCVTPLRGLPDSVIAQIRHLVGQVIVDPTGNRQELRENLDDIADE